MFDLTVSSFCCGSNNDIGHRTHFEIYLTQPFLRTAVAIGNDFTIAQHAEFHHNASNAVDYPHTFFFHPVYRKVDDATSDIVAIIDAAVAWDASLNNLLPQNVGGLLVDIYNNCNQTFQFELDGEEAFYLGEGRVIPNSYPGM